MTVTFIVLPMILNMMSSGVRLLDAGNSEECAKAQLKLVATPFHLHNLCEAIEILRSKWGHDDQSITFEGEPAESYFFNAPRY